MRRFLECFYDHFELELMQCPNFYPINTFGRPQKTSADCNSHANRSDRVQNFQTRTEFEQRYIARILKMMMVPVDTSQPSPTQIRLKIRIT